MFRILGKITKRLMDQHGKDSAGWNPPRSTPRATPEIRRGAIGKALGGKPGRKKGKGK